LAQRQSERTCGRATARTRARAAPLSKPSRAAPQVDRPRAKPVTLVGHAREVTAVAWAPTEPFQVVTCGDDASVRVWALQRRAPPAAPARERRAAACPAAAARAEMGPPTPLPAARPREPGAAPATAPAAVAAAGARAAAAGGAEWLRHGREWPGSTHGAGAHRAARHAADSATPLQRTPFTPIVQLPAVRPRRAPHPVKKNGQLMCMSAAVPRCAYTHSTLPRYEPGQPVCLSGGQIQQAASRA